jgi:hypothetical protein
MFYTGLLLVDPRSLIVLTMVPMRLPGKDIDLGIHDFPRNAF